MIRSETYRCMLICSTCVCCLSCNPEGYIRQLFMLIGSFSSLIQFSLTHRWRSWSNRCIDTICSIVCVRVLVESSCIIQNFASMTGIGIFFLISKLWTDKKISGIWLKQALVRCSGFFSSWPIPSSFPSRASMLLFGRLRVEKISRSWGRIG